MAIHLRTIVMREIRLPLKEPFRISSGVTTDRRILLIEATDADGVTAWSECVAGEQPNYSAETIDTAWFAIKEWIGPRLLRRSFAHPCEVTPVLDLDIRDHRMAKAAIEMVAWAILAERENISLSRLIGGSRNRIPTGISLGIQTTPDELVEKASRSWQSGYRRVKMKIAPGADLQYVSAVRRALGPEAPLMADANTAYRLADADHLGRLEPYGLMMIEQPLGHDDLVQHAELQKRLTTPICLDESITTRERAQDMIALKSGRIVNIKPGRVGGFAEAKAIHDLCEQHGVPVWCGGMLESGVGRAYNVALASLPNFTIPGDVSPSARYWTRDIVSPEWTMDAEGMVQVPRDRPGIGVEVDRERVKSLTIREERIAP